LFVQSNDGDLYPQGGDNGNNVMMDRADQSWCGYAYFGVPDRSSAGKRYVLIVALATHGAERRLEREMQGRPIGQVPHWRSLPAGFEQLGDARVLTRLPHAQAQEQLEEPKSCLTRVDVRGDQSLREIAPTSDSPSLMDTRANRRKARGRPAASAPLP
jgi:hypothetical protein